MDTSTTATQSRLAAVRERISSGTVDGGVPPAVWEDAERQLTGMLTALSDLAASVPLLGDPSTMVAPRVEGGDSDSGDGQRTAVPQRASTTVASPSSGSGGTGQVDLDRRPPPPLPPDAAVCALSIAELGSKLRRRELSPVEVTRAVLDRIGAHEATLCTFITLTAEQALDDARRAERDIGEGRYRGALHGVPVALKDLYATRGVPTTAGSAILRNWVPDEDAVAVAAWREAGAIFLGKNTLHEFAFGGTSVNAHTGTPRNPWNPAHMCGGSSGGSAAAVAAGFAFGAFGSETGNSVRRPAAFCGVVGIKPTFGRISRRGVWPLAWTLDHVGVFARTPADAAQLLAPLAGFDPADPGSRRAPSGEPDPATALAPAVDLRGRRAGVPRAWLAGGLDPDVESAFEGALAALRARGVEIRDLDLPLAGRWTAAVSSVTMHAEAAALHARWLRERPHDYGHDVLPRLLAGAALSAADYARAQAMRGGIVAELLDRLQSVDLFVAPSTPAPAPLLAAGAYVPGDAPWGTEPGPFQLQRLFSLTGLPVVSAPVGLGTQGLPLGIQIAARPWQEGLILGAAAAVMDGVPRSRRAPLIAPL